MLKRISALIFSILLLSLIFSQQVFAYDKNTEANHIATRFEKVVERVNLLLKFNSDDKIKYYSYLTDKRLTELEYIVSLNDINNIEESSSRYASYLGNLKEMVIKNKQTKQKNEIVQMMDDHLSRLEKLRNKFKYDSAWWLSLKWSFDTAKEVKDTVQK
ncbi:hypothetical protein KW795_02335 [Candidatus Microgenomates bacterium]|nr:hypothetical protein [Candidatus Microgenomates bacterium]